MTEDAPTDNPFRLIAGLVLLGLGLLLVLDKLGVVDRDTLPSLIDLWPVLLVVIGVRAWLNTEGIARWFGALFAVAGAALLVDSFDVLARVGLGEDLEFGDLFEPDNLVPVVLVIGGLFFLFGGRLNRSGDPLARGGRRVGQFTMFGGADLRPRTDDFRGGWIAAVFGGFELDLRECDSTVPESTLDALCLFGGGEIRVPEGWEVELSGLPLFGGFGSDVKRGDDAGPPKHLLKVHCVAMFGGLSVEN